ncbi:hypothetical protein B566_EDAN016405, partial [Ephemera danica]
MKCSFNRYIIYIVVLKLKLCTTVVVNMELSHSLTLNEAALNQLPETKRPVFILEWLRFLDKVLAAAHKADIKECQQRLVEQLTARLHDAPGPPARRLIARNLATLFSVGDTFLLFDTCLLEMLNQASFLYTTELENVASLCFRALDGSTYEVRCGVARLLGALVARTQETGTAAEGGVANSAAVKPSLKTVALEDALSILMSGFLRGGGGAGFLKGTGEIIKGTSTVSRELRVGVTHAYVLLARTLGPSWLERNVSSWSSHLLELVASPKAAASHVDAVYSRKCVAHVLRATLGRMLGERAQLAACKELTLILVKQMASL